MFIYYTNIVRRKHIQHSQPTQGRRHIGLHSDQGLNSKRLRRMRHESADPALFEHGVFQYLIIDCLSTKSGQEYVELILWNLL